MFAGSGTKVTTRSSSDLREPVVFYITVDLDKYSGINVADVRHLSKHTHEEEVLFDLGHSVQDNSDGNMMLNSAIGNARCRLATKAVLSFKSIFS